MPAIRQTTFEPGSRGCSLADVAERLMERYEATLSLAVVSATVRATARMMGYGTAPDLPSESLMSVSEHRLASMAAASS